MPTLGNPFNAVVPRKLTKEELKQAIRLDIAGELDAIYGYEAHAMATDDEFARAVLLDISREEKVHIGELMTLLRHLDADEADAFIEGEEEVKELMEELGIAGSKNPEETIGRLRDM